MFDLTPALPTFVITLREGVEAALVVGIVLAYLQKAGQARLKPWVYGGIAAGLLASLLVGAGFGWFLWVFGASRGIYTPVFKPLLQGIFSLAAIVMLSWMLIWMTQQSRQLKAQVEGAVSTSLTTDTGAGWGIFGLIFLAVLREGFETVLFLAAKMPQGWLPIVGAIGGIIAAVVLGLLLFQGGVKINLRYFFLVMGIFLLFIVAGLVLSALAHLDAGLAALAQIQPDASWCISARPEVKGSACFLGTLLWDSSRILPERQFPGIILHTLFGYEDQVYLLEAIAYLAFWLTVGTSYLRSLSTVDATPSGTRKPATRPNSV